MFERLKVHIRKLRADLKPMNFSEKVDHIWTYYKEVIWLGGVALMIIIGMASTIIMNLTEETVFNGLLSNVTTTNEGSAYLTDAFHSRLELKDSQKVTVGGHEYIKAETNEQIQNIYSQAMGLLAQVNAQALDYVFMNEASLEFFVAEDFYMDLRELLSEEELAELGSNLRYAHPEGVDVMFPIAINVTDMPFVKDCLYEKEDIWLVFVTNTKRKDTCRLFWEHLVAWESTKTEN